MTTWAIIYRDEGVCEDPVLADDDDFRREATDARRTASNVREVTRELRLINSFRFEEFDGQAAHAITYPMAEVVEGLEPVEHIFDDMADLLAGHAYRLSELRNSARYALSHAVVHWRLRNEARAAQQAAGERTRQARSNWSREDSVVRMLENQLAGLGGTEEEVLRGGQLRAKLDEHQSSRARAARSQGDAERDFDAASRDIEHHEERLRYWHRGRHNRSYVFLHEAEEDLNRRTAQALRDIDLRGLADPGALQKVLGAVGGFLSEKFEQIFDAVKLIVEAAITADLGAFLHGVRDLINALDFVLLIVAVVALAIPGLNVAALAGIALVMAGTRLVLTATLATFRVRHPVTNTTLGWTELGIDTAKFALAAVGFHKINANSVSNMVGGSRFRDMVSPAVWSKAYKSGILDVSHNIDLIEKGYSAIETTGDVGNRLAGPEGKGQIFTPPEIPEVSSPQELVRQQTVWTELIVPSEFTGVQPRLCGAGG